MSCESVSSFSWTGGSFILSFIQFIKGIRSGTAQRALIASATDWLIWTHGGADGESVAQVTARADRVVAAALEQLGTRDVVLVGHGHFSRAVITRWLQLPLAEGARFAMTAGSLAVCGFEHGGRQLAALGLTGPR